MDKAKILIVEDEVVVAHDIKSTLERLGYEVTARAATAEDALASARETRPDLVLMDIVIKGDKDGISAAATIREELEVPVIYLTAYSDEAILERAKTTEPYGYIIKPFQERELHSTIEMALYKSRAERRIVHLNRVLRAIRNINQLIVHEKDGQRLIERACEILSETQGYYNVWIALYDETGALSITAQTGVETGFESLKEMLRAGDEIECIKKAKLSPQPISIEDPYNTCAGCPLVSLYEGHAGLAARIEHEEKIFGFLVVSTTREIIRDEEELDLFRELAQDLGLALQGIALDEVRRRAKKALQESESKYKALFIEAQRFRDALDKVPSYVYIKDIHSRYIYANQLTLDMFKCSAEELIGCDDSRFFPPDTVKHLLEIDSRVFNGETTKEEIDTLDEKGKGNYYLEVKSPVVEEPNSTNIVGLVGISTDITERKKAEEELRKSEETHRALVAGLPDIVMRFDRDGRHLHVSKNVEDVMTIGAEEFIGKTHRELGFSEADCQLWEDGIHQVFDSGTAFETEFSFDGKKGPTVFNWRLQPEFDTQGEVQTILTLSRDITARLQMEREKAELAGKMLQQQRLEAVGTLASGVAHEINNPINGVINYAQLLLDESVEDSNAHNFAKEIITETERVATIVRNLLAFSRHDKQAHRLALITDIVEVTLSLVRTIIRHDQITLVVDVPETLPKLKCRSQQIQQVLMNLMTNARDALNDRFPGHDDAKTLSVTAAVLKREGRRWIRVTVKDNGAGIPPEIQEHIFEPFFTTKTRDKGTGLGLSISYGIIKDHHGEIRFESSRGNGTMVEVELPVDNDWTMEGGKE
jgi:PAS domain S-box-containing protein